MGAKKQLHNNNLAKKFPLPYRQLGKTELYVSPICFGSMRLTPQEDGYKEALKTALDNGINFIDTSGSYGDGASELLIGELLREEIYSGQIKRDDLVISTKVGQIQGHLLHEVKKRNEMGHPFREMVQLNDSLFYCLTPDFIEHQITHSLKRLNLDYVDVVMLQNPEVLLQGLNYNKQAFINRLQKAFEHLEVEVVKGRIKYYGISSAALLKKEIARDFISIKEIMAIVNKISKKHHFCLVQSPFNLFETTAILEKNQERNTLLEEVKKYDLSLVTYRPLTSHHRDKVHYFITFKNQDEVEIKGRLHKLLTDVLDMEKLHMEAFPNSNDIRWGHVLRNNLTSLNDWWKWNLYFQKQVKPTLYKMLENTPEHPDKWRTWKIHYSKNIFELFDCVRHSLEVIANLRTNQICHYLNENCKSLKDETKLSNKVTRIYLSLDGIDSIVMGLGAPEYVQDLLDLKHIPDQETALKILKDIRLNF